QRQPGTQLLDLVRRDDRWHPGQYPAHLADLVEILPGRHLRPGQGTPAVEAQRLRLGEIGGQAAELEPGLADLMPLLAHGASPTARPTGPGHRLPTTDSPLARRRVPGRQPACGDVEGGVARVGWVIYNCCSAICRARSRAASRAASSAARTPWFSSSRIA